MDISEWAGKAQDTSALTVEQLDNLILQYSAEREEYEKASKESKRLHAIYKATEETLINTLRALGKKSYKVEGVGNVTVIEKSSVTVPKEVSDKRALFGWIKDQYGDDVLDAMVSINHNKLNGFFNEELEKNKNNPLFEIPGLSMPSPSNSVQFRRSK